MAEQAAQQAREMQSRTAKPAGNEVRKDADGNIIGSNISTDGVPMPQVKDQPPPGLAESGLVGGVGIYGSGQDQDGAEVEARGVEENERRTQEAEEVAERAAAQEAEAQEANAKAQEAAKKPAKGKK